MATVSSLHRVRNSIHIKCLTLALTFFVEQQICELKIERLKLSNNVFLRENVKVIANDLF